MISNKVFKIASKFLYGPSEQGQFFSFNKRNNYLGQTYGCREQFRQSFRASTAYVGYFKNGISAEKISDFFEYVEGRLKLNQGSVVYRTDDKRAVIVELSPFWRENAMNRGFFTLFLRCAARHYHGKGTFSKAISNYSLAKKISPAITWFLKGNTKSTKSSLHPMGVVSHFTKCTNYWMNTRVLKKDYKTLLTKP